MKRKTKERCLVKWMNARAVSVRLSRVELSSFYFGSVLCCVSQQNSAILHFEEPFMDDLAPEQVNLLPFLYYDFTETMFSRPVLLNFRGHCPFHWKEQKKTRNLFRVYHFLNESQRRVRVHKHINLCLCKNKALLGE